MDTVSPGHSPDERGVVQACRSLADSNISSPAYSWDVERPVPWDEKYARYEYLGCFSDQAEAYTSLTPTRRNSWEVNGETSIGWSSDEHSFPVGPIGLWPTELTHQCAHHCHGYRFFALQNGTQCFCGDESWRTGSTAMPESDCNFTCVGDSTSNCGGIWRNSVYRITDDVVDECTFLGVRDSPFPLRVCQLPRTNRLLRIPGLVLSAASCGTRMRPSQCRHAIALETSVYKEATVYV
jgi:hypothetical protein